MHISNWKKYVFKIFFQPWKISIEHNSGDGTEIRYFQIPSYPIPRNKWHKRGLPTHDSFLNLCPFLLTQTVSRMIQGTIYIPLCTLAITYNPTPCSHGNKWYPQLGFESYSSRKDYVEGGYGREGHILRNAEELNHRKARFWYIEIFDCGGPHCLCWFNIKKYGNIF